MLAALLLLVALSCVSADSVFFTSALPGAVDRCASYHGRFGATSVFRGTDDCLSSATASLDDGSIIADADYLLLLHAEPAAVEWLTASNWIEEVADALRSREERSDTQTVFSAPTRAHIAHVQRDSSGVFISIPSDQFHSTLLRLDRLPMVVYRLVAPYALPPAGVPQADRDRVNAYLQNLTYNPEISHIVHAAFEDEKSLHRDATWLSGERSGLRSRHSFTNDVVKAAEWVKGQVEGEGGPDCELYRYAPGFGPSVICRYEAATDTTDTDEAATYVKDTVVMAAHLDSRGSWGYARAGGGDDDGSGSTMLLAVARSIRRERLRFRSNVVLAWFTGEEQGLVGSRFYAKRLRDEGVDVKLMVQADMIAFRKPGEPLQIAFPAVHSIPEGRWLAGNLSTLYASELVVGITPACCSDSQSFDDLGFASTWTFERNGPIGDPFYHNSGDLVDREGYSFEQLGLIGRVYYATLLTVAEYSR